MDFELLGTGGGSFPSQWTYTATIPSSASAAGTAGQFTYDESYLYLCIATNTWVKAPLSTW